MQLRGALTPERIKELGKVVYEPCFISSKPLNTQELSSKMAPGYELVLRRFLGPFGVYGFERKMDKVDRYVLFNSRKDAATGVAQIMESAGFSYLTAEVDKKPVEMEDLDPNRLRGLSKEERNDLRQFYKDALEKSFLTKLREIQKIEDYPKVMLDGLNEIRNFAYPESLEDKMNDPHWLFFQIYINPMAQYLDYRIKSTQQGEYPESLVEAAVDYDFILNLMKFQSTLLIGEQKEPQHRGVLIPIDKLEGATNYGGASVWLTEKELVIWNSEKGVFKFPLPEKTKDGEVAIKGGIARLVAKIVLEHPVEGELPPSDLDLVAFGELKDDLSLKALKEKYGVEAKDLERITKTGIDTYLFYLANRDQGQNEVLLTKDGLVLSLNALSVYLQNSDITSSGLV